MAILDEIWFTLRTLRNKVPFLLVALAMLGVSMGVSTAKFTVVNAFLLSSLPYQNADRLVTVWSTYTEVSKGQVDDEIPLSAGAFTDLSENAQSFERVAALISDFVNVNVAGEPDRVHFLYAMGGFFSLLHTPAAIGRTLGAEDERPGAAPVVVISHGYWQRQFGGDPEILGRTLEVYGREHEVVGVLPADFRFSESLVSADPRFSRPADVWAPLNLGERARARGAHFLVVVGLLEPGTGLEAARDEIRAYVADAARRYPETDKSYGMKLVSLHDQVFGHLSPVLLTLWAAAGFVLLVACANLATLLLARGQTSHRDVAVRLALGATPSRITWQSLLESCLLSLAGGLLSLPVAYAAIRLVTGLSPINVFHSYPPRMDLRALAVSVVVSLAAGLLFGLVPALRASRIDAAAGLREGSAQLTGARSHLTFSAFVVLQIALATTLLIGTGLSLRSFVGLLRADLGINPERVES